MIVTNPIMQRSEARSPVYPGSTDNRIHVVRTRKPPDFRLLDWVGRQIITPRRLVRLLAWAYTRLVARPWWLAREFVAVQFSGNVTEDEYAERQAICVVCPTRVVRDLERGMVYCGSCGCPKWGPARLDRKNWKSRHRCPKRLHPGTYPDYSASRTGCRGDRNDN